MPSHLSRPPRPWIVGALPTLAGAAPASADDQGTGSRPLVLVKRSVIQDQGSWQVDYQLRHEGATGLVVTPTEIVAKVEGWVSNSRAPGHSAPRWSSLVISGPTGLSADSEVITSADEERRCREHAVLRVWTGDAPEAPVEAARPSASATPTPGPEPAPILSLAPGASVCVRLRLEHQHALYGDYNPLLGLRTVELRLGSATFRDVAPLDREHHLALPKVTLAAPHPDRLDTTQFISGPDSLHLYAHPLGGSPSYRFPEIPVRYSTPMRLRFWYLIAPGTEGDCRVRVQQCKDIPATWRMLIDGELDQCLTTVGRWTHVEQTIRTEPEATRMSLDFRIAGSADAGAVWIDDVTLEPLAAGPSGP
jgi:hypothetical protein